MPKATLTRRGRVVVAVCVIGGLLGLAAGGRALDAVVLPGIVALVAGYVQLARVADPEVRRVPPQDGFVGERREVRIELRPATPGASGTHLAAIADETDDGLEATETPIPASIGEGPVTYRVRYLRRGKRQVGPATVTATDVFGLFEREVVVDDTDAVTAYPVCHPIPARFRGELYAADAVGVSRQREEFDRLREYARGDALRDVHWPTTAKRDEIVVKEFAAETRRGRVSIAGATIGTREGADALASAAASLALALLDDGVPVDLTLPAGSVSARPGPQGRRAALELAAVTGPGPVAVDDADVAVIADADGARYRTGGRTVAVDDLRASAAGGDPGAERSPEGAVSPPEPEVRGR
ncbi:DUF58 domain-containing protein [Halorubrum amylolyticum]|uniref:DUF58 domain-containing protein n=1 Tax=Halorubrum amylolyticum TaxID=2508724 RepID=UPI0010093974|nr:DUF58 domain-containing protein [Halorubrum amylolyticum]